MHVPELLGAEIIMDQKMFFDHIGVENPDLMHL